MSVRNFMLVLAVALFWVAPANAVVFQYGGQASERGFQDPFTLDPVELGNVPAAASLTLDTFIPTKDGGYYPFDAEYWDGDVATVNVYLPDPYSWLDPYANASQWLYGVPQFHTNIVIDAGKIISFSHSSRMDVWGPDIIGSITMSGTSNEWSFAPYGDGGFSATLKPGFVEPFETMDLPISGGTQQISWTYFSVDSLENVGVTVVPEPAEWTLIVIGFSLLGQVLRSRTQATSVWGGV